jgi:hypothetical protein
MRIEAPEPQVFRQGGSFALVNKGNKSAMPWGGVYEGSVPAFTMGGFHLYVTLPAS